MRPAVTMSKFKLPSFDSLGEDDSTKFQAGALFKTHKSPEKNSPSQNVKSQGISQPLPDSPKPQPTRSQIQSCASLQRPELAPKLAETSQESPQGPSTSAPSTSKESSAKESEYSADAKPDPPVLRAGLPGKTNSLIVSRRQRGNPILKHIRNVPWEFGEIIPDYQLGQTSCALYLSLRYHALHPAYIQERIKQLGYTYDLRVLLVQVDVKDPHHSLKELAKLCLFTDCTLILAWSAVEAGTYLETFKAFESKPPDLIMEKMDTNFYGRMVDVLTTVKKVNKTDAATLISNFETMERIVNVDEEELALCSGFGPQKAKRLLHIFHEPFLKSKKKKKTDSSVSTKQDESGKTPGLEKR